VRISTKEILGDVRYNAIFFMLGISAIGAAFAFALLTSLMPYAEGGPVAGGASEYALFFTLGAGLMGVGFISLGLGALVFSQNYEPIKGEAQLITFSAIPYGVFLLAAHAARVRAGGPNDIFAYSVARTSEGTATIIVWSPESFGALAPFLVIGSFAAAVCCLGLAYFMGNMKIVKEVGGLTLALTRLLGVLLFAGYLLMYLGWSAFGGGPGGGDWFGAPFILYFTGYMALAFGVPIVGVIVAYRVGSVFWDAAKTVRYLSDFRKKAAAAADEKARTAVDDRPWWEKLSEEGEEKK
jgi:hypothetical protein